MITKKKAKKPLVSVEHRFMQVLEMWHATQRDIAILSTELAAVRAAHQATERNVAQGNSLISGRFDNLTATVRQELAAVVKSNQDMGSVLDWLTARASWYPGVDEKLKRIEATVADTNANDRHAVIANWCDTLHGQLKRIEATVAEPVTVDDDGVKVLATSVSKMADEQAILTERIEELAAQVRDLTEGRLAAKPMNFVRHHDLHNSLSVPPPQIDRCEYESVSNGTLFICQLPKGHVGIHQREWTPQIGQCEHEYVLKNKFYRCESAPGHIGMHQHAGLIWPSGGQAVAGPQSITPGEVARAFTPDTIDPVGSKNYP